jgi:hypothetical protein
MRPKLPLKAPLLKLRLKPLPKPRPKLLRKPPLNNWRISRTLKRAPSSLTTLLTINLALCK